MPAGTGKTYTATLLISDRIKLKKRLLVLVGTEEIFDQWIDDAISQNINYGYINQEGVVGRGKNVYICMWQSLSNLLERLPEKFVNSFSEIITDECHHSPSPTLESVYDHFKNTLRMGLTATPLRLDNKPLGKYYNKMLVAITQEEAIKQGYLCRPIVIVPKEYKNHIPDVGQMVSPEKQKEFIKHNHIIGDMVKLYRDVFNGLPVIVPCSSHAHAVEITKLYKADGWIVHHLHGGMNKLERKKIINDTRKNKVNILVTYGVGIEGMDIKTLAGVIWLRKTMSLTIWIQLNSRPARIDKNKNHYILVDPMGNIFNHSTPDINRKWSLSNGYEVGQDVETAPSSRICPNCSVVNSIENDDCWICGYNWETNKVDGVKLEKQKRRLPTMIEGELVYLNKGDNNERTYNIISNDNDNNSVDDIDKPALKKADKLKILQSGLTGVNIESKFKEGLKWL